MSAAVWALNVLGMGVYVAVVLGVARWIENNETKEK